MVVFTCNNCGESLQKPRVEKHYQMACRNAKNLTCVDCLKDFGDDYTGHMKCLTEVERYSAKGSVVVGAPAKGEQKQGSWMEMINAIINEQEHMKVSHRNLLNSLANYNNVPRKKIKFENFVKSSLGGRAKMEDVEAIWELIEAYKNKNAPKQENKKAEATNGEEVSENKRKSEETATNDGSGKKKKKKQNTESAETSAENSEITEDVGKKQKKKQKGAAENTAVDEEVGKTAENGESPVKKSKKRKSQGDEPSTDANSEEIKSPDGNGITGENAKIKKRKRKSEIAENGATDVSTSEKPENTDSFVAENETKTSDKKQKKKQKQKTEETNEFINGDSANKQKKDDENENGVETSLLNDSAPTDNDEGKFDIKAKILGLLEVKNSIALKKLEKKIVKEYAAVVGEIDSSEKVVKKLNKKLKKLDNVTISDGIVTLVQ